MAEPLWRLDGVGLGRGDMPRLADVTVDVLRGVTAVLGCSGAGKTSLVNLLVGFEQPDAGTISTRLPAEGFCLQLYWVPQGSGLWPHLTVRQHLEAVAPPGVAPAELARLLDRLHIGECAESYPDELSAGQSSRVALARALAADAGVLVMDEPLAHVDEARAGEYWTLLREHVRRTGASLIFATHASQCAIAEAEHVICLQEGRVLYSGHVRDLYDAPTSPAVAECLGVVNWLEPEEARLWLGDGHEARRCYRPEQVTISPAPDGPLVVESCRFAGSVAEAQLRHASTGRQRTFYHRPSTDGLRPGQRVVVRVLLALLATVVIACGGRGEPALSVRRERYWSIPADGPSIPAPRSVAVGSDGEVFVLDTGGRVLVYGDNGSVRRQWRMPDVATGKPEGICVLRDGRVAVCDTHYMRVLLFDREGRPAGQFGTYGTGPGQFIYPVDVVQDDRGHLYVCEYGSNDRVQEFTPDGQFVSAFGAFGTGPGEFQRPSGMAWRQGTLYVADAINNRVQMFSADGRFLGVLGSAGESPSLHFPYDIAVGPDDALYVVEYGAGRVSRLALDGRTLGRYGATGTGVGQFRTPWSLAVTPDGRLLIADTGNRRVVELTL